MDFNLEEALNYSEKVLGFIASNDLTDDQVNWITEETLTGFRDNCNPGFLEYHKSISSDYTTIEWKDNGAGFTDLQGRKYIDCLRGYGVYNLGHRHPGVIPDILCLGKAFGGGVMPIGAFVSTEKICDKMIPNPFMHSTTFGGNPLACAAAIAAIQVILDEGLVEQAAEKGSYLLPKLQKMTREFPVLKEARGKGLMIGLEFSDDQAAYKIVKGLFENGILVAVTLNNAATIRVEPALTIEIEEIDQVIEVLEKVIKKVSEE